MYNVIALNVQLIHSSIAKRISLTFELMGVDGLVREHLRKWICLKWIAVRFEIDE